MNYALMPILLERAALIRIPTGRFYLLVTVLFSGGIFWNDGSIVVGSDHALGNGTVFLNNSLNIYGNYGPREIPNEILLRNINLQVVGGNNLGAVETRLHSQAA